MSTEFAYAVAYTRSLENRMLTKADFDYMLKTGNFNSAAEYLRSKGYFPETANSREQLDRQLKLHLEDTWADIKSICKDESGFDILLLPNDFHNIKVILKCSVTQRSWEELAISPSLIPVENIADAVKHEKFTQLPPPFDSISKNALSILKETQDAQTMDIFLDKAYFDTAYDMARGSDFFTKWVKLDSTLANMNTILRCVNENKSRAFIQNAVVPYGEISQSMLLSVSDFEGVLKMFESSGFPQAANAARESIGAFEKWRRDMQLEFFKNEKNHAFGAGPVAGFLMAKSAEIRNIRILMYGLLNNSDNIKERLGEVYV